MNIFRVVFLAVFLSLSSKVVFAEAHAFPVPFVAKKHSGITFTDLPGSGSIKIFSVDGEELTNLPIAPGELAKQWNVTTVSGKKLASGVYLYIIDSGNGAKTEGKLVVVR